MMCNTFQANKLQKTEQPEETEGTSLRMLVVIGTSLSKTSSINLRKRFPLCFITNVYPFVEVGGAICMYNYAIPNDIKHQYEKPLSCGKLLPGVICKIVDPVKNRILKVNEGGELRYKIIFPNKNLIYCKVDEDAFVRTNLLGYYDENHCIYILDSYDDIFRHNCKNVFPMGVENVIKDHPAVDEAIVLGIRDENKRQNCVAVVQLKKHMSNRTTIEDLQLFTNSTLKRKVIKKVKIVREIPPSASGIFYRQNFKHLIA